MSTVMLIPIIRLDAVHSAGWYWRGSVLFVQRIASPTPTGSHVPSGQRPKLHFWFVSSRTACLFLSDCQHDRAIKYVYMSLLGWVDTERGRPWVSTQRRSVIGFRWNRTLRRPATCAVGMRRVFGVNVVPNNMWPTA